MAGSWEAAGLWSPFRTKHACSIVRVTWFAVPSCEKADKFAGCSSCIMTAAMHNSHPDRKASRPRASADQTAAPRPQNKAASAAAHAALDALSPEDAGKGAEMFQRAYDLIRQGIETIPEADRTVKKMPEPPKVRQRLRYRPNPTLTLTLTLMLTLYPNSALTPHLTPAQTFTLT